MPLRSLLFRYAPLHAVMLRYVLLWELVHVNTKPGRLQLRSVIARVSRFVHRLVPKQSFILVGCRLLRSSIDCFVPRNDGSDDDYSSCLLSALPFSRQTIFQASHNPRQSTKATCYFNSFSLIFFQRTLMPPPSCICRAIKPTPLPMVSSLI